jgi:phosphate transport system substrate-binding protein
MAKSGNETTALVLTLLVTAGLAGGGYYFFQKGTKVDNALQSSNSTNSPSPITNTNNPSGNSSFSVDTSLPNPTKLAIDGSTTMVALIKELRNEFAQVNPNIPTEFGVPNGKPNGSSQGIANLINNQVLIAASSRPLNSNEAGANIQLVAIAKDAVAVVVGDKNPYKGGLTLNQVRDIYQGKITNWSQVGGINAPIKVINRATKSGTRELFQNVVMLGQPFAPDGANFSTRPQDDTTPILQALGSNGIGYATVSQVENQVGIVRILPIDGISPTDKPAIRNGSYPISRSIYLGIHKQTSPAVKQFVDLALSSQGQRIVERIGFVPLQ